MTDERLPAFIVWNGVQDEGLQGNTRDHYIHVITESIPCTYEVGLIQIQLIERIEDHGTNLDFRM
jgi:hypothetical protein